MILAGSSILELLRRRRNVLLLGTGRVSEALLNLVLIRIYSQLLSVTEVGRLSLLLAIGGFFLQVFLATAGGFFLRQITEWRNEWRLMREVLSFCAYLLLMAPVAVAMLGVGHFSFTSIREFPFLPMMVVVIGVVVLQGAQQNFVGGINILGQRGWFVLLSNLGALMALLSAAVFIFLFGRTAVVWQSGWLLGLGSLIPVSVSLLWKHRHDTMRVKPPVPAAGIFSYGAVHYVSPLILISLCFWVQNFGYRLIIADRADANMLGIFTIGFTIGTLPILLIAKISNDYLVPAFFRKIAHASEQKRVEAWREFAVHYIAAALITAPMTAAAAHFYSRFLVAPTYWPYAWLAWFGAGAQLLTTIYGAYLQFAQGMMNNKLILWANILASILVLVATYVLTPLDPLVGPGVALLAGGVTLAVLTIFNLHDKFSLQLPLVPFGLALGLGLAGAVPITIADVLIPEPGLLVSFAMLGLTGSGILLFLWLFIRKFPLIE